MFNLEDTHFSYKVGVYPRDAASYVKFAKSFVLIYLMVTKKVKL